MIKLGTFNAIFICDGGVFHDSYGACVSVDDDAYDMLKLGQLPFTLSMLVAQPLTITPVMKPRNVPFILQGSSLFLLSFQLPPFIFPLAHPKLFVHQFLSTFAQQIIYAVL